MERVQIAQAKAHLSALLDRVEAREEIILAPRGRALSDPVPESPPSRAAACAPANVWAPGRFHPEAPR